MNDRTDRRTAPRPTRSTAGADSAKRTAEGVSGLQPGVHAADLVDLEGAPRVAVWARVSSHDQRTENQLPVLRRFARSRGWTVVREYVVEESASNGAHRRDLRQAEEAAHRREFDVLLVWALDRLTREGAEAALRTVRRFDELGVRVVSHEEPWVDSTGEVRELLISVIGWVAKMESRRRGERIRAGLARRAAEGRPVGRREGAKDDPARARRRSAYVARWEDPAERARQSARMQEVWRRRRAESEPKTGKTEVGV